MNLQHPQWGNPEFSSQPATLVESLFRHSGWAARRRQVYEALQRVGTRPQSLEAFAECGSALYLNISSAGDELKLTCNCCRSRWCTPCATARGRIIAENVKRLAGERADRWLTLTLRHSNTALSDQIARLYDSFSKLRKQMFWKDKVRGGAAFCELKISDHDGRWHVHLHVLVEGSYIVQQELSSRWHGITGDSSIVDIRKVPPGDGVARYLCKYVTKPADASVFARTEKLDEMITALRGRHLCFTFGTWRRFKLSDPPDSGIVWKPIGAIETLIDHHLHGDAHASRFIEAAIRKWPELQKVLDWSKLRTAPSG